MSDPATPPSKAEPAGHTFVQQVVGRLPLDLVTVFLNRLGAHEERDWDPGEPAKCGWRRYVLEHQIKGGLRAVAAPTQFTEPSGWGLAGQFGSAVGYALASAASPVAVADYYGLPGDGRAALPSATELQAVITDEIARIDS